MVFEMGSRRVYSCYFEECCLQLETFCMATHYPSRKPSKLDEQDMRDNVGEVRTDS